MDRCALFVDAGYLLADGAMAVHGTRHRETVSWDFGGLLQMLGGLARERTGLPLLRCYWYESTVEGRRAPEHETLADLPGLKLRLGRARPGRGEGVDTEIHRDLMTLARNGALADAVVVAGDEGLAQVVVDAQDLGVRVSILHVALEGDRPVCRALRQECDDLIEMDSGRLRPFVSLLSGADGPSGGPPALPAPMSNGHSNGVGAIGALESAGRLSSPPPASPLTPPPASSGAALPPLGSSFSSGTGSFDSGYSTNYDSGLGAGNGYGSDSGYGSGSENGYGSDYGSDSGYTPDNGYRSDNGYGSNGSGSLGSDPMHGTHSSQGSGPSPGYGNSSSYSPGPSQPSSSNGSGALNGSPSYGSDRGGSGGTHASPLTPPPSAPPSQASPSAPLHAAPTPAPPAPPQHGPSNHGPSNHGSSNHGPSHQGLSNHGPAGFGPSTTGPTPGSSLPGPSHGGASSHTGSGAQYLPSSPLQPPTSSSPYTGPQQVAPLHSQQVSPSLSDAVKAAHQEGQDFGESVARDAPALWLEAVLARKPRMPSDLEARLLQGSSLPIDFLLHDEVRHALRRGFWDALDRSRR